METLTIVLVASFIVIAWIMWMAIKQGEKIGGKK